MRLYSCLKCAKLLQNMFYTLDSSELLHLFFISNSEVFVDGRRKNVFHLRAQGTLATPLVKVSQPEVSKVNFSVFQSSCYLLLPV